MCVWVCVGVFATVEKGGWEFLDIIKKLTTHNQNNGLCCAASMVVGSSRSVQGRTAPFLYSKDLDLFELIIK